MFAQITIAKAGVDEIKLPLKIIRCTNMEYVHCRGTKLGEGFQFLGLFDGETAIIENLRG